MNRAKHPLYKRWWAMMDRCYNPNNPQYAHVGALGMTVNRRWHNPDNYFEDIESNFGLPSGSFDLLMRKDSTKPFGLSNTVGWSTYREVTRNKRNNFLVSYKGQTRTVADWSEITGIKPCTIYSRIRDYGYTPAEALGFKKHKK
jgi:hypothetical protein